MTVTYQIEAEELNEGFLESLRSLFKGRRLVVTVEEKSESSIDILTTEKALGALLSTTVLSFSIDEFEDVTSKINNGKLVDIEPFKITAL